MKKNIKLRKIVYICLLLGAAPFVFIFFVFSYIYVISAIGNKKSDVFEPQTGFTYELERKYVKSDDFDLLVTEIDQASLASVPFEHKSSFSNWEEFSRSEWFSKNVKVNDVGIQYVFVSKTTCYENTPTNYLDAFLPDVFLEVTCSDNLGLAEDRYYVYLGDKVYLFTTEYPTRGVYHDFSLGFFPRRIGKIDFADLIKSLNIK